MIGKVITEIVFDAGPEENLQWQEKGYGSNLPNTEHLASLTFETSASLAPLFPFVTLLQSYIWVWSAHSEQLHLGNLSFDSFHPCVLLSNALPNKERNSAFFF